MLELLYNLLGIVTYLLIAWALPIYLEVKRERRGL